MAAKLVTIFWRDIPAQVVARSGRQKASRVLPGRFQTAIDRAAMKAGKTGMDEYVAEWRQEAIPCGDDLETAAVEAAERLDREYDPHVISALVKNEGWKP